MRQSESANLLPQDPEIERTYTRLLKEKKNREVTMMNTEEKKALWTTLSHPSLQQHHAFESQQFKPITLNSRRH